MRPTATCHSSVDCVWWTHQPANMTEPIKKPFQGSTDSRLGPRNHRLDGGAVASGTYHWLTRDRRWCNVMSNYFDHFVFNYNHSDSVISHKIIKQLALKYHLHRTPLHPRHPLHDLHHLPHSPANRQAKWSCFCLLLNEMHVNQCMQNIW